MEGQIGSLESEKSVLQSDLANCQEELQTAFQDVKKYAESVTDTQNLYQQELIKHGKSMEASFALKEQVRGKVVQYTLETSWTVLKGPFPLFLFVAARTRGGAAGGAAGAEGAE